MRYFAVRNETLMAHAWSSEADIKHDMEVENFWQSVATFTSFPHQPYTETKQLRQACLTDGTSEGIEIEFHGTVALQMVQRNYQLHQKLTDKENKYVLVACGDEEKWSFVVQRDLHNLTKEEETRTYAT